MPKKRNEKIESLYPKIGQEFFDVLPPFSEGWISFETIGDVWGAEAFYKDPESLNNDVIHYLNENLQPVEHLLQVMREEFISANLKPFTQATFWLSGAGKFSIDFGYEDVSDFGRSSERREVWMKKYIGENLKIDWGNK